MLKRIEINSLIMCFFFLTIFPDNFQLIGVDSIFRSENIKLESSAVHVSSQTGKHYLTIYIWIIYQCSLKHQIV